MGKLKRANDPESKEWWRKVIGVKTMAEEIHDLRTERDALAARVKELEKDRERLDYAFKSNELIMVAYPSGIYGVSFQRYPNGRVHNGRSMKGFREAIDAAMKAGERGGE